MGKPAISQIASVEDVQAVKSLFMLYAEEGGLQPDLNGIDRDFVALPGEYHAPDGLLLLARIDSIPAGCVGVRKVDEQTCEIRRLFVRPEFRRNGIGRELMEVAIAEARRMGYKKAVLDTLRTQIAARQTYQKLGFFETRTPRPDAASDVAYMELQM